MTAFYALSSALIDWPFKPTDVPMRVGLALVLYLAFTFAQRLLVRHHILRKIGLQLNLFALVCLVSVFLEPLLKQMHAYAQDGIRATAVFLGIAVGLSFLDTLIFDSLPKWRGNPQMPQVLRDIMRWMGTLLALFLIVHSYFPNVNLNVVAASSLVVGYIVGNASQDTLSNLFAGLTLNTERPFHIGDWVTVSGHTGRVVDTTWRATRLRTKSDDYIVIPNALIGKESITNYSRPTGDHACQLAVGVSYDTPPNRVRQVILDVLSESPGVSKTPMPSIYLVNYGDYSIQFTLKFYITDYAQSEPIKSGVMDRLWYAFRREDISIPFPVRELRSIDMASGLQVARQAEKETIRKLLAGVDLFQSLAPEEINWLADGAKLMLFARGESLCRQDEAGDSFYIIRSGQASVWLNTVAPEPLKIAQLGRADFFGEMSLLTGEPRSATVRAETDVEVLCLTKVVVAGVLKANSDLAGKLAAVLNKRAAQRQTLLAASNNNASAAETEFALVSRIRRFFGLLK